MGCGSSVGRRYNTIGDGDASVLVRPATNSSRESNNSAAPDALDLSKTPASSSRCQGVDGKVSHRSTDAGAAAKEAPRLELGRFQKVQVLEKTVRSTVFCLRDTKTGQLVAGKRVQKDGGAFSDCKSEVQMLQQLSNVPAVVALQGVCDMDKEFWMIFDLYAGGNFEAWLRRFPKTTRDVSRQLLEAAQHLHSMLICHLDLAPDNILLEDNGSVRLCDFETACQLSSPDQRVNVNCGTGGFKAPEVGRGPPYFGLQADVFSVGKILQKATLVDMTWSEAMSQITEMCFKDPLQRPALSAVHIALFQGKSSEPMSKAEREVHAMLGGFAGKPDVSSKPLPSHRASPARPQPVPRTAVEAAQWAAPRDPMQPPELQGWKAKRAASQV